jgi:putative ABC transport system permease protein
MLHDLRYSFRLLLKNPGFSVVAVLSLALGIAATTTIFSVVYAGLLRALPYREPNRLVMIYSSSPKMTAAATTSDVVDWRAANHVFEQIEMFSQGSNPVTITAPGLPERVKYQYVTQGFFPMLGTQPALGRVFTPDVSSQYDQERGIVISYGYWQRRFQGDRAALGQTITMNGDAHTIIGVMPANFHLGSGDADIWRPVSFSDPNTLSRQTRWMSAVARLKPGVSIEQARAEMITIAGRLQVEYPATNKEWSVRIDPLHEALWGFLRVDLYPLLGAVGFILLIACANVASLMLARSAGRAREMAVRAALGAKRWRLVRQLLSDGVVLSLAGGLIGVLMAAWGVTLFVALAPAWFPLREQIKLDGSVLVFSTLITIATGILTALAPAFGASKPDLNDTLKSGERGVLSRNRGLSAMVVAEVALTLILMIGGGLMVRTFVALRSVNTGFDPSNVLTAKFEISGPRYVLPAPKRGQQDMRTIQFAAHDYYQNLVEGVAAIPGVESAGLTTWLPFSDGATARFFRIAGEAPGSAPIAEYVTVSPDTFRVLRIPLRKGRYLNERDTESAPWVALVNEAFARRYFANGDPIGKMLTLWTVDEEQPREIVGVVADVRQAAHADPRSQIYVDFHQQPMVYPGNFARSRLNMTLVVRAKQGAGAALLTPQIRTLAAELDRAHPVFGVKTMDEVMYDSTDINRFYTAQLVGFAALALLLASVGIYGVMSYAVRRRRREIGIRMALGASHGGVLRSVLGQGLKLALIGLVIGLAGSFALTRAITSYLYGVKPTDPETFLVASVVLVAVALGAVYRPARRATEVDPVVVLRCD